MIICKNEVMDVLPEQTKFLEGLYREYFNKLVLYATSELEDKVKAQDIVQDTFHAAILHIDNLMTHENPGGWLMQTVKNKVKESRRTQRRYIRQFVSLDSDVFIELIQSIDSNPELSELYYTSTVEKIRTTLTGNEFYVLKRYVFDHASHMEIANELGISVWASQKRLERIRKKLFNAFPERKKKK